MCVSVNQPLKSAFEAKTERHQSIKMCEIFHVSCRYQEPHTLAKKWLKNRLKPLWNVNHRMWRRIKKTLKAKPYEQRRKPIPKTIIDHNAYKNAEFKSRIKLKKKTKFNSKSDWNFSAPVEQRRVNCFRFIFVVVVIRPGPTIYHVVIVHGFININGREENSMKNVQAKNKHRVI